MKNANSIENRTVWGFGGTIIWGIVVAVVYIVSQIVTMSVFIVHRYGAMPSEEIERLTESLMQNGDVISYSVIVSFVICSPLLLGIAKLKKGSVLNEYFGLKKVKLKESLIWFAIMLLFILASDTLTLLLGKPLVPEFMTEAYLSAESLFLLVFAFVFAAPVVEELFFRGFLIPGISLSFFKPIGAVIISSALWAVIHLQYGLYGVLTILFMGIILGIARVKTGSVILTIGMHSIANIIATLETLIIVR